MGLVVFYEFHAYAGHEVPADRLLREHERKLPTIGQSNTRGSWTMAVAAAEGLAVLGDFARSAAFLPVIEDCIERTGVICVAYRGCCRWRRLGEGRATLRHCPEAGRGDAEHR